MTRLLLPEEFGLIGMITIFMKIGITLIESGMSQSLIRSIKPDQEDYSTVFIFNLLTSILIYCILFLLSPYIAQFFDQPILKMIIRLFCLSFIFDAFGAIHFARLTKQMKFKIQMQSTVLSLIIAGIIGISMAYKGYGVWSLVFLGLFDSFLKSIFIWIKTKWIPSMVFNVQKFKYHFNFGYKLMCAGLIDTLFKNTYVIVFGKYFSVDVAGYYTRADSLKQMPTYNIFSAINNLTYPMFSEIQENIERLKIAFRKVLRVIVFVITPLLSITGFISTPIFRFIFTEKWLPAVPYFQILCIVGVLYPIISYNFMIMKVKGRSGLIFKLKIVKLALVLLTIGISYPYGIFAILWSQVVANFIALCINIYYTQKIIHYGFLDHIKDLLPILLLAFFSGILTLSTDNFLKSHQMTDIIRILIGGLVGVSSYLIIAWMLKYKAFDDIRSLLFTKKSIS